MRAGQARRQFHLLKEGEARVFEQARVSALWRGGDCHGI